MKYFLFLSLFAFTAAAHPHKEFGMLATCDSSTSSLEWELRYVKSPERDAVTLVGALDNPHGSFIKYRVEFELLNSGPGDFTVFSDGKGWHYVHHPQIDSRLLMESLTALAGRRIDASYTCSRPGGQ